MSTEEIKYVEEAPASQPSVRQTGAWVPGYPKDRLDSFLDDINLLVNQAREQATLAETRASQATLEAYNAAAARQAAAASALEGLSYSQAASVSANKSSTEADRSETEADRAKTEADRSVQTIADHKADPEAHAQYLKKALPAGTTANDQFLYTMAGFKLLDPDSLGGGGVKVVTYTFTDLDAGYGWDDLKLSKTGEYILQLATNNPNGDIVLNGPASTGYAMNGSWYWNSDRVYRECTWRVSVTQPFGDGYVVQLAYSDKGVMAMRTCYIAEGSPKLTAIGNWVILANQSAYSRVRPLYITDKSMDGSNWFNVGVQGTLDSNCIVLTRTATVDDGFLFRLPLGAANGIKPGTLLFIVNQHATVTAKVVPQPGAAWINANEVVILRPGQSCIAIQVEAEHNVSTDTLTELNTRWMVFGSGNGSGSTFNPAAYKTLNFDAASQLTAVGGVKNLILPNTTGEVSYVVLPDGNNQTLELDVHPATAVDQYGVITPDIVVTTESGGKIITDGAVSATQLRLRYKTIYRAYSNDGSWCINDCVAYTSSGGGGGGESAAGGFDPVLDAETGTVTEGLLYTGKFYELGTTLGTSNNVWETTAYGEAVTDIGHWYDFNQYWGRQFYTVSGLVNENWGMVLTPSIDFKFMVLVDGQGNYGGYGTAEAAYIYDTLPLSLTQFVPWVDVNDGANNFVEYIGLNDTGGTLEHYKAAPNTGSGFAIGKPTLVAKSVAGTVADYYGYKNATETAYAAFRMPCDPDVHSNGAIFYYRSTALHDTADAQLWKRYDVPSVKFTGQITDIRIDRKQEGMAVALMGDYSGIVYLFGKDGTFFGSPVPAGAAIKYAFPTPLPTPPDNYSWGICGFDSSTLEVWFTYKREVVGRGHEHEFAPIYSWSPYMTSMKINTVYCGSEDSKLYNHDLHYSHLIDKWFWIGIRYDQTHKWGTPYLRFALPSSTSDYATQMEQPVPLLCSNAWQMDVTNVDCGLEINDPNWSNLVCRFQNKRTLEYGMTLAYFDVKAMYQAAGGTV